MVSVNLNFPLNQKTYQAHSSFMSFAWQAGIIATPDNPFIYLDEYFMSW